LSADERPRRDRERSSSERDDAESVDNDFGMDRLFVPRWRLTDGPHVRAAFREVIKDAAEATVCIHCDDKHSAIGGVIRSDGWIITKATPLCGKLTVVLADGRKLEGTTVAKSGEYDLALLKVDAKNLPTLDMSTTKPPAVGSWLASVGRSRDPLAVGIVSVPPREIPPQAGVLGVQLDEELALVVQVFPESPADEAGLEPHDRIVRVNGKNTPTREKLKEVVGAFNPGDNVELVVDRDGKSLNLKATLGGSFPGLMGRSDFQNSLGGKLSVRRFGFPLAFQHDTVLRPSDCGGPVVDVDGRVVGFNIARAGRTESYALPVSAVQEVVGKLMSEKLTVEAQPVE
jgi:serine protease Do